ncbi:MAG TPA: malate dehydrogenase (quinone) [Azoarcus sp.]|nr:malate dehydrogenase (quinone) [Azoarcus sp.]
MSRIHADVVLVGGGVMSATLGTMLSQLDPSLQIVMVERLDHVAHESTNGWNNAGTGHAGYCELNYTPKTRTNDVQIDRALKINAEFEISLQFWSYLVEQGALPEPSNFINATPHHSFVWGEDCVEFLRKRHAKLRAHHLFREMQFSEDRDELHEWIPLIVKDGMRHERFAATRVDHGADVDFGSLTRKLVSHLETLPNFKLLLGHSVQKLMRKSNGQWSLHLRESGSGRKSSVETRFVFLGAGGAALPLLQKSGIQEGRGYGGFPVSGQWLVCQNPEIVKLHHAKVYGLPALGAPPMSVPHLDTRIINGEPALLFGPFAGFTTRFLKQSSRLDLFTSMRGNNLRPMVSAGRNNLDLTRYLISEVFQSHRARMNTLQDFVPDAVSSDWTLRVAGQRVQIIKQDGRGGGALKFGTEIVSSADGSLAVLLGASPGASTATNAMLEVLQRCFPKQLANTDWQERLRAMIPSWGNSLIDDADLLEKVRSRTLSTLGLRH